MEKVHFIRGNQMLCFELPFSISRRVGECVRVPVLVAECVRIRQSVYEWERARSIQALAGDKNRRNNNTVFMDNVCFDKKITSLHSIPNISPLLHHLTLLLRFIFVFTHPTEDRVSLQTLPFLISLISFAFVSICVHNNDRRNIQQSCDIFAAFWISNSGPEWRLITISPLFADLQFISR